MRPAPTRRSEAGAATLELTGMVIVVVVLVLGLLVVAAPQGGRLGETYAYWVCRVVTFGQGGCTPPGDAVDRTPEEPCEVQTDTYDATLEGAVTFVTLSDGRRLEITRLSDGRLKITVSRNSSVGLEAGVGGGVTINWGDDTIGGSASAGVGGSIKFGEGDVYYVDPGDLDDFKRALLEETLKDELVGEDGITRWGVDKITDLTGVHHELPEPDEVFLEGGLTLNADAEATDGGDHANAGISATKLLGVKVTKDGSKTAYVKTTLKGDAGLKSLDIDAEAYKAEHPEVDLGGEIELVTAVTFDSKGNMTTVQMTGAGQGEAGITSTLFGDGGTKEGMRVYQATLPIRTPADQEVADAFLATMGVHSLGSYVNPLGQVIGSVNGGLGLLSAAKDRGTLTQQDYDQDSSQYGATGSVKLLVEAELGGNVTMESMTSTGAKYWNGHHWVEWEGCAA